MYGRAHRESDKWQGRAPVQESLGPPDPSEEELERALGIQRLPRGRQARAQAPVQEPDPIQEELERALGFQRIQPGHQTRAEEELELHRGRQTRAQAPVQEPLGPPKSSQEELQRALGFHRIQPGHQTRAEEELELHWSRQTRAQAPVQEPLGPPKPAQEELERAALDIQRIHRGRQARAEVGKLGLGTEHRKTEETTSFGRGRHSSEEAPHREPVKAPVPVALFDHAQKEPDRWQGKAPVQEPPGPPEASQEELERAALDIQRIHRGRQTRAEIEQRRRARKEEEEQAKAALQIQSVLRGRQARAEAAKMAAEREEALAKQQAAAQKQAQLGPNYGGRSARQACPVKPVAAPQVSQASSSSPKLRQQRPTVPSKTHVSTVSTSYPTPVVQSSSHPEAAAVAVSQRPTQKLPNLGGWEQRTLVKLEQARELNRKALRTLVDQELRPPAATSNSRKLKGVVPPEQVVAMRLKSQMGAAQHCIKVLESKVELAEDQIRKAGDSLLQVKWQWKGLAAPLQVCNERLEMRSRRPEQELVVDSCQRALESERKLLTESLRDMSTQMEKIKVAMASVDIARSVMLEELMCQRKELRATKAGLSPRHKSSSGSIQSSLQDRSVVLPPLDTDRSNRRAPNSAASSPRTVGSERKSIGNGPLGDQASKLGEDKRQELQAVWQRVSKLRAEGHVPLVDEATKLGEELHTLVKGSLEMSSVISTKVANAATQVHSRMTKRMEETHQLRRQLEVQLGETEEMMMHMKRTLEKTEKKLAAHEGPLSVLDNQLSTNSIQSGLEVSVKDLAQDELEAHVEMLRKAVDALEQKKTAVSDILGQLRKTRDTLQEDLKGKLAAERIDEACLKVSTRHTLGFSKSKPAEKTVNPTSERPGDGFNGLA